MEIFLVGPALRPLSLYALSSERDATLPTQGVLQPHSERQL